MSEQSVLKPCPFCGGKADTYFGDEPKHIFIKCGICHVRTVEVPNSWPLEFMLRGYWNTRTGKERPRGPRVLTEDELADLSEDEEDA